MNSSIAEALVKVRPDLNKDKKFRALSAERRASMMGDYRDPDADPAQEGTLNDAELSVGSEINRQMARDAQAQLVQSQQFYRKHAMTLGGLTVLAAIGLVGFAIMGRSEVRARAMRAGSAEAAAIAAAPSLSHTTAPVVVAAAIASKSAPAAAKPAPRDEDEIPVFATAPVLSAKQNATLSPILHKPGETDATASLQHAQELIPAAVASATRSGGDSEKMIASISIHGDDTQANDADAETASVIVGGDASSSAPQAKPAETKTADAKAATKPAAAKPATHADGLVDGASIANASSINTGAMVPIKTADPVAEETPAAAGEVLYESAPVPAASAATAKAKASRKAKPADGAADDNELRVSGIFWDKTRPLALINDKIVEVGSTVNGAKVVSIEPSAVTLDEKGKQRTLHP